MLGGPVPTIIPGNLDQGPIPLNRDSTTTRDGRHSFLVLFLHREFHSILQTTILLLLESEQVAVAPNLLRPLCQ